MPQRVVTKTEFVVMVNVREVSRHDNAVDANNAARQLAQDRAVTVEVMRETLTQDIVRRVTVSVDVTERDL